jgi:hypothetical protein
MQATEGYDSNVVTFTYLAQVASPANQFKLK